MQSKLTRRGFIKLGVLSLSGLAFNPYLNNSDYQTPELQGRVTIDEIDIYRTPLADVYSIIGKLYRDQVVTIYYSINAPEGPAYNPVYHRIWGGFVYSAYVQLVKTRLNSVLNSIVEGGQLCEVTVPYTDSYRFTRYEGWVEQYRLYYETTHWVTGIDEGPDGEVWYIITNELDQNLSYYAPAIHLRPIPDEEISPLSSDVPPEEKRIEVSILEQKLTAFEGQKPVFSTKVSTGIHTTGQTLNGVPTHTPRGEYHVQSKSPSKHMGSLQGSSGAPEGYSLPGVPWTSFFIPEVGIAFHGAYWHNNFGVQMSRGCVNMRPKDAKWLFRWCLPLWEMPVKDRFAWDRRGYGTLVKVY